MQPLPPPTFDERARNKTPLSPAFYGEPEPGSGPLPKKEMDMRRVLRQVCLTSAIVAGRRLAQARPPSPDGPVR